MQSQPAREINESRLEKEQYCCFLTSPGLEPRASSPRLGTFVTHSLLRHSLARSVPCVDIKSQVTRNSEAACFPRGSFLLFLCLMFAALIATPVLAQQPVWSGPITPATPNGFPLYGQDGSQSSVYDAVNDRLIVFGGRSPFDPSAVTNETWILVNASGMGGTPTWMPLNTVSAPPPRMRDSAVYDPGTNRMIIAGGETADAVAGREVLSDVWILTNANGLGGSSTWIQRNPTGGPPPGFAEHGAFYDQASNAMVIITGNNDWLLQDANDIVNQPNWQLVSQSGHGPSVASLFLTSYDPTSHRVTIFGGCCTSSGYGNSTFVGTIDPSVPSISWTALSPGGNVPGGGNVYTYGYDPGSNTLIALDIYPGDGTQGTWLLSDANAIGAAETWTNAIPGITPGVPPYGPIQIGSGYNPNTKILVDALNIIQNGNEVPQIWILKDADASTPHFSTVCFGIPISGSRADSNECLSEVKLLLLIAIS